MGACVFCARVARRELEVLVCGSPGIDVPFLRRHTRYDGINPGHPVIGMFWEVLAGLTPAQQASVMRFMWARERLPSSDAAFSRPFIIARMPRDDPDSSLPQAHTCVFQVGAPVWGVCVEGGGFACVAPPCFGSLPHRTCARTPTPLSSVSPCPWLHPPPHTHTHNGCVRGCLWGVLSCRLTCLCTPAQLCCGGSCYWRRKTVLSTTWTAVHGALLQNRVYVCVCFMFTILSSVGAYFSRCL
jgi:hypothetical protein